MWLEASSMFVPRSIQLEYQPRENRAVYCVITNMRPVGRVRYGGKSRRVGEAQFRATYSGKLCAMLV